MNAQIYSIDEIREIIAPIAKQHGVEKVFLFDSYARGDATAASDIDALIIPEVLRDVLISQLFNNGKSADCYPALFTKCQPGVDLRRIRL